MSIDSMDEAAHIAGFRQRIGQEISQLNPERDALVITEMAGLMLEADNLNQGMISRQEYEAIAEAGFRRIDGLLDGNRYAKSIREQFITMMMGFPKKFVR